MIQRCCSYSCKLTAELFNPGILAAKAKEMGSKLWTCYPTLTTSPTYDRLAKVLGTSSSPYQLHLFHLA